VTEAGVPAGIRRTGRMATLRIPVADRFEPRRWRRLPTAYLLDARDTATVALLRRHGIAVERLASSWSGRIEAFIVDSIARAERAFQGHRETTLAGHWLSTEGSAGPGSWVVRTAQPLGRLAVYLLEPESDDGVATWGVVGAVIGEPFPVRRAVGVVDAR
jgi:hypothetical protein